MMIMPDSKPKKGRYALATNNVPIERAVLHQFIMEHNFP